MESDTAEIKSELPPENQDLSFLQFSVGTFLAQYGWYVLILSVGVYLLLQYLRKNGIVQAESPPASASSYDSTSVARRQEALEASRKRMQEELDAKAAEFREKQQRLEEEKRRQKIEMWDSMKEGKSHKGNSSSAQVTKEPSTSTASKPKSDKKPLRNSGFNPLSGEGGGTCAWRPGRRGPSAGG